MAKTRRRSTSTRRDPVLKYARDVLAGRIVAGPLVRLACERHLRDLREAEARGIYWDLMAALRAISFFPDVLRLAEGEHAGRPFVLELWQQFIVGSLFGWKRRIDGMRRFHTAYCEIGKGNGKTPMVGGTGLYMTVADGEIGAHCYAAAVTRDQAQLMFQDAVAMVEQSPPLSERLVKSGTNPVFNLAYLPKRSFFRPVSSEHRGLDGKRVYFAGIDEIHEHRTDIVVEKMSAGTKGRRQALIFEITNSGHDRTSVCWEHHDYSERVLRDVFEDDSWFAYVCALDEGDDWVNDEACWIKANPNLGVSITQEYLRRQVREARGRPSKRSLVARLNFCVWTETHEAWIDWDLWSACGKTPDIASLRGRPCYGGLDLSGKLDLSSLALAFPWPNGDVDLLVWSWTPADTLRERAERDRAPYPTWAEEGHIIPVPGKSIDYGWVAAQLAEIAADFEILGIAYDRYRIEDFERECAREGVDVWIDSGKEGDHGDGIRLVKHGQGFVDMSVAIEAIEEEITSARLRHGNHPVLTWCAANAVVQTDPAGLRKFNKPKSVARIDALVASAMACRLMKQGVTEGRGSYLEDEEPMVF